MIENLRKELAGGKSECYKEIADLLIAKGADINVKNIYGHTPLDRAGGIIADLLRKHGGKTGEELKAESN